MLHDDEEAASGTEAPFFDMGKQPGPSEIAEPAPPMNPPSPSQQPQWAPEALPQAQALGAPADIEERTALLFQLHSAI